MYFTVIWKIQSLVTRIRALFVCIVQNTILGNIVLRNQAKVHNIFTSSQTVEILDNDYAPNNILLEQY